MAREENILRQNNKRKPDFLDALSADVIKQKKILLETKNVALRKPDPNFVDALVDDMLAIPTLEHSVEHTDHDDEESLSTMKPTGTPDTHSKRVEIEVRVGALRDGKFRPGISKHDFDAYYRIMTQDPEYTVTKTEDVLYYYERSNGSNIRLLFDEHTQRVTQSELKQRLKTQDFELSSLPYAVRVSIASEMGQPAPGSIPPDYKLRRKKFRWSFSKKGDDLGWKIDLTQIRTQNYGEEAESESFEIEFEFNDRVIDVCLSNDRPTIRNLALQFFEYMVRLINLLPKSTDSHFDRSLNLEKVTDEETLNSLKETCVAWIPGMNAEQISDFPGSMPVNFCRQHIPIIQRGKYFISEKTDGIRAMMLIYPHHGAYLIDRRFDFYLIRDFDSLLTLYATDGITLLDGEMVNHIGTKKPMYLIFDLVALNGQIFGDKPLMHRLQAIGQQVVSSYRNALQKGDVPADHPFVLMGKNFFPIHDFYKVAQCVHQIYNTRVFKDEKRYHKTDGYIFTPDEPYCPKTVRNLYKWKYNDEWSIDLKLHYNKATGHLLFKCAGDRNSEVEFTANMKPEDIIRLSRYMAAQPENQTVIVECVYDTQALIWKLKTIRTDKNRANHIRVVQNTIDVIQENVTAEELLTFFAKRKPSPHTSQHQ